MGNANSTLVLCRPTIRSDKEAVTNADGGGTVRPACLMRLEERTPRECGLQIGAISSPGDMPNMSA